MFFLYTLKNVFSNQSKSAFVSVLNVFTKLTEVEHITHSFPLIKLSSLTKMLYKGFLKKLFYEVLYFISSCFTQVFPI